jgi:polysaccharide export outer membrane protein
MKTLKTICLKPINARFFPEPERGEMSIAQLFHQRGPLRGSAMCFPASPKPGSERIVWIVRCYKYFVPAVLNSVGLMALLVLLNPFQARAQEVRPNANEQSATSASPADLYRIGAGDVLEVRVYNRPQLSRDAVRVDNRGMIRMPIIESDIVAGCRTESELAGEVAALYLKYQRHPHVDVFVKDYSSKPVAVIGAVDKPGQFQLQRRVRLLELVSLAGGPTERAGQRILVAHSSEISPCSVGAAGVAADASGFESYDLNNTLKADAEANPYVRSGDIITLPEAQQVFVVGNVFHPTSISLKERITVSQAVAMAGGTMSDAKKESIRILRQLPGSSTKTEIVVDLNAISKRKAEDVELKANDIVEVPTSTGKRLLHSLINAVIPGASGLPLRVIR